MDKSKFFTGQPIFSQMLSYIPLDMVQKLAEEHQANRYYKKFKAYDHLVTMLYTCLRRCESLREVTSGMLASLTQLPHLRVFNVPRRSTLSDANRSRNESFFAALYHRLYKIHYGLPDSSKRSRMEKRLFILDSTTIHLFSDVMKGVGEKPSSGKSKGGAKAHIVMNANTDLPYFATITEGIKNDRIASGKFSLPPGSILVFDKGYNNHAQFNKWTEQEVTWVTRMSDVAHFDILEDYPVSDVSGSNVILSDQAILLGRGTNKDTEKVNARLIFHYDAERNRTFGFVTNNFTFSAHKIADLYKKRWQIELLFKRIKHHYPLRYFLGDNENAIKIQIWCALISDLLIKIIKDKIDKKKWSYAGIASMVRLHLMHYLNLIYFLNHPDVFAKSKPPDDTYQFTFDFRTPPPFILSEESI